MRIWKCFTPELEDLKHLPETEESVRFVLFRVSLKNDSGVEETRKYGLCIK